MDYKAFARKCYSEAFNYLETIGNLVEEVYEEDGEQFDKNYFYAQFDCILQFSMLEMAIADGKLHKKELELIRDITQYGDLVTYVNSAFNKKITWNTIIDSSVTSIRSWLNSFKDKIESEGENLMAYLVIFDTNTDNEYTKGLTSKIHGVAYAVNNVDGKLNRAEEESFYDTAFGDILAKTFSKIEKQRACAATSEQTKPESFSDDSLGKFNEENSNDGLFDSDFESILNSGNFCESSQSNGGENIFSGFDENLSKSDLNSVTSKFNKKDINDKFAMTYDNDIFGESVVYIESDEGCGTGFVVTESGYVVTCAHVVIGKNNFRVKITTDESSEIVNATVVCYDKEHDFALLKMQQGKYKYCKLANSGYKFKRGKDIVILGYPFGRMVNANVKNLALSLTKGYISSIQKSDITNVYLDISAKSGNSGSPVIDYDSGEVIGILCGSLINKSGELVEEINYMRPITYFWDLFTK